MQTPKASKSNSSETPQKISSRTVRQLKTTSVETSRASSSNLTCKTPKDNSPKVIARRSPKSPATEKKRPSKISELESQISHLQEELKNTKDQLTSSESWKMQAEKNEEELKEKLLESSSELKESRNKLSELYLIQETHETNLQKISQDRDQALERAESTEEELKSMRENMNKTLSSVEDMKEQLRDCQESESQAKSMVTETLSQLENAKKTIESLQMESTNANKAYNLVISELDQSRANVNSLEGLVKKLKAGEYEYVENEKIVELETELGSVKNELSVLKTALEHEKIKYNEERINSTLMINSLNETAEFTRSSFSVREAELEASLCKANADAEEMKAILMDKETEVQAILEENKSLVTKLDNNPKEMTILSEEIDMLKVNLIDKESEIQVILEENKSLITKLENNPKEMMILREEIEILKGNLMDKETESQNIAEENEMLKMEIKRREMADLEDEIGKKERDARVERVAEHLAAVQAANGEMEAELRRLKVQSDQWRKAAEVAAAMVANYSDGKFVERTGSLDSGLGKLGSSPYDGDIDDEMMKKKNGNVLKKIGVLWKKPQK